MEPRHCPGHGQAQSATLGRSRFLEPAIFPHCILAKFGCYSRATVADADFAKVALVVDAELDGAAFAAIFQRIVHEVSDCPANHLTIAHIGQLARTLELEGETHLFDHWLIDFADRADELIE